MKNLFGALLLFMLSANVAAMGIPYLSSVEDDGPLTAFDVTALLADPMDNPIWGIIAAGADPNASTIIPLNFDVFTGEVFQVSAEPIRVTELPTSGAGFILETEVGYGLIPDNLFEVVLFDQNDWHTADKFAQVGTNAFEFLFEPDVFGPNPVTSIGGTQAGMLIANSEVSAIPVPAAAWLFGSGLIGLTGIARRRKDDDIGGGSSNIND